jgi:coenzyme F420 hydrogenase subunit beta
VKSFIDIDLKLCHSCGTCVGICPNAALSITENLPELVGDCSKCGLCFRACPGIEFNYPRFNEYIFGENAADRDIGYHRSIYIGHSTNEAIRNRGASGGVVTALLLGLLEKKEIKAAIVVGMKKEMPWVAQAKIVMAAQDIFNAAQSKYSVVPVNETLRYLEDIDGDIAFVGLPCHIHGVRKLQEMKWEAAQKIKYCIGIFCGFNMKRQATDFLIEKFKLRKGDIDCLEYRGGPWPGGFLIKTKEGKKYFLEKHIYNYLNLIFVPERCLVCPDLTNEFADISVGDYWSKIPELKACSSVVVRSSRGRELFDSAVRAEDVIVVPADKRRLKEGHSQIILYKKRGVFIRRKLLELEPNFNISLPTLKLGETVFNIVFFYLIYFMKTRFAIGVFKRIPTGLPGILGRYARFVINFASRPKRSKLKKDRGDSLFNKIIMEYKFLTTKNWSFRDVGNHWDSITDYDDINRETYSYFRRFTDGHRLSNLPKDCYVLDICSRTGNGALFFKEKGIVGRVLCADFSQRMQAVCFQRLKNAGVSFQQRLIDSLPLPFNDREFDVVFSFETVEHISTPDIFIKELGRVIKPGGQMILTTPNKLWRPIHSLAAIFNLHHSEGPCRFISRAKLRKFISEAGFEILTEKTTVLIPNGPGYLLRVGEWLEEKIGARAMSLLGLRQIFVCKKNSYQAP